MWSKKYYFDKLRFNYIVRCMFDTRELEKTRDEAESYMLFLRHVYSSRNIAWHMSKEFISRCCEYRKKLIVRIVSG